MKLVRESQSLPELIAGLAKQHGERCALGQAQNSGAASLSYRELWEGVQRGAARLGDAGLAKRYDGGPMLLSRLCPVDYHRFHFPCAGKPGPPNFINGWLYSVNPIALITRPSIFWENKRVVTAIESPALGQVQFVEIGATMVGSIRQTYTPGETVAKGDEKGYFAFGGSSVAVLFEKGRIEFDTDLLKNTDNGLETYARVGERMGRALDQG